MITYVPLQNVKMQLQRCLMPILVCAPFCLSLGFKMMSASKRGIICHQMHIKVMFEASFLVILRISVVFYINLKSFLSENPKLTLAKMKIKNMPPGTAKKCFQLYCSKYQGDFFYLTAFSVKFKCHHQPGFGCQSNYF